MENLASLAILMVFCVALCATLAPASPGEFDIRKLIRRNVVNCWRGRGRLSLLGRNDDQVYA